MMFVEVLMGEWVKVLGRPDEEVEVEIDVGLLTALGIASVLVEVVVEK